MNNRFFLRLTAPVVLISLLLLAVSVGTAWYVHHWQKIVFHDLRVNVSGVRAAEELEILVREARTRLDHFLITNDRKYLEKVPELRQEIEYWLGQAERWALTPHEQDLVGRARRGLERFWSEWRQIAKQGPAAGLPGQVRRLIDELVTEVLEPTHQYLDFNEEEVEEAIATSQVFADRLVYALLLLGTCGSAAGLVAGFGFARGLSRSLIQLSVLIRDAAGRLDGSGVDVEPLRFSRGDLAEMETVMRLIGERVEAIVERLQQKEREVLLAQQMAAFGQLAAGMAHELRNPLTSMKILVQGAMNGGGAEGEGDAWANPGLSSRDLGILEEEITRLEQLIRSFLDFARPPKPEKRILDLRPLVEQTLAFVGGRASASAVRIDWEAPATPARAAVDPPQFRQVLLNLVLNALDAMPGGGTINVRLAWEENGWLKLQVADSGCGLPPALGDRIFDPFTTTKETGLGLGLSICMRIAKAHGGVLTGGNRAEGGAVFTLRLPAAAEGRS